MAAEEFEIGGTAENAGTVQVSCGSNSIPYAGAGKSVADIRNNLKKVINIGTDTRVLVNGVLVDDEKEFIIQSGMSIEFVKEAGQKGKIGTVLAA